MQVQLDPHDPQDQLEQPACQGYSLELEGGDPKRIYMKENYDTYLEGGDPKRISLGIPPLGLLTIYYEKRRKSPYAMLGSRGGRVYAPDPNHRLRPRP